MKYKKFLAGALACAATVALAQAQPATQSPWYFGVSAGSSTSNSPDSDAAVTGATTNAYTKNKTSTGYKIVLGKQLNKNLAVEFGYVDLGSFEVKNTVNNGTATSTSKHAGVTAMAVGIAPATDRLSFMGKIGLMASSSKADIATTGSVTVSGARSATVSEGNLAYGLGVQYDFSKTMSVRAEYDVYAGLRAAANWDRRDVNLLSLGLVVKF
jgi:OOP family OmpA-OmpF porin